MCIRDSQYTVDDLKPAHARSYEPRSVNTGTTVRLINLMMDYYKLTADNVFFLNQVFDSFQGT